MTLPGMSEEEIIQIVIIYNLKNMEKVVKSKYQ
jgi:hypothetical protein